MDTYRIVPNPTPNPGAWAIEWCKSGRVMAHICEGFQTEAQAQFRIDAITRMAAEIAHP